MEIKLEHVSKKYLPDQPIKDLISDLQINRFRGLELIVHIYTSTLRSSSFEAMMSSKNVMTIAYGQSIPILETDLSADR